MMKFNLKISLAILLGMLAIIPVSALAQDDKQVAFEREWYDICYTKKDKEKCLAMSKQMKAEYPSSQYNKNAVGIVEQDELKNLWDAFNKALQDYYAGAPNAAKLDTLYAAGEAFMVKQPDYPYVVAQLALAGSSAVLAEAYTNKDKAKMYAEKSLKVFEPTAPTTKDIDQAQWNQFRENLMAQQNQYLGYYLIQTKGDKQQAIDFLGKSIAVKAASGNIGWKDPNNYWLRATLKNEDYVAASKEYSALPDDQKTGEAGKAALKKIGEAIDKLLPDYARVIAVATTPAAKPLADAARDTFNPLWKFRTGDESKAAAYLQAYVADPTIPDVAVPAKPETADNAMPVGGVPAAGANVKLSAGSGQVPGAAGAKAAAAAPAAKAKAAPAKKKKR